MVGKAGMVRAWKEQLEWTFVAITMATSESRPAVNKHDTELLVGWSLYYALGYITYVVYQQIVSWLGI